MVDTHDFLQADDVEKVKKTIKAVDEKHHTDIEIEKYFGAESNGRQGRYYRLAAVKLGFVSFSENHAKLTDKGQKFLNASSEQQKLTLVAAIKSLPVFSKAVEYINKSKPTRESLKQWFVAEYPGEESTAERRFSTFIKYLKYCGIQC